MRILITGAGRGGTSLVRELVRGLGIVGFYRGGEEDRNFFKYSRLPKNYGTKLTIENEGFTLENLIKAMKRYTDLRIVFSLRHPVDNCMSKIVRGQRRSDGGDSKVERLAPDATVEGAIITVKRMRHIHKEIVKQFSHRIHTVMMEDLILNPEREVNKIAMFLGVKITKRALEFYKHNTNRYQKKRYGTQLDASQIGLYERWDIAFNGFFKNREKDIKKIKRSFK